MWIVVDNSRPPRALLHLLPWIALSPFAGLILRPRRLPRERAVAVSPLRLRPRASSGMNEGSSVQRQVSIRSSSTERISLDSAGRVPVLPTAEAYDVRATAHLLGSGRRRSGTEQTPRRGTPGMPAALRIPALNAGRVCSARFHVGRRPRLRHATTQVLSAARSYLSPRASDHALRWRGPSNAAQPSPIAQASAQEPVAEMESLQK